MRIPHAPALRRHVEGAGRRRKPGLNGRDKSRRFRASPAHTDAPRDNPFAGDDMGNHVYKMVELVGSSTTGTDDAIRNAVATAAASLRHLDWFEVVQTRGHLVDGQVGHFQVTLKVAFRLDRDADSAQGTPTTAKAKAKGR
jgi:flavin-binding protein dodecin